MLLETLQLDAVAVLQAAPDLATIQNILREQQGDIQAQIKAAIAKLGLVIMVMTPSGKSTAKNAPGPILDPLILAIDITEMVLINRGVNGTRIPCSEAAERVAWAIHGPNHPGRQLIPNVSVTSVGIVPDPSFLIYRVEALTRGVITSSVISIA